eukprot:TRINITY_DN1132_c0_g1_i1.p1 TRINITY_DN1132_c0_g1~~TRINITY_DN1132_c0_g1_i1.p1  ORF type:complete len:247 (-),score=16.09 TRINITY_DN1132_c0_g1_i1:4-744(-)
MNSTVDSLYTAAVRASMVKDFQRKWATKLDARVLFDRVESVDLSSDTLRTEFATCVWSVLRDIPDLSLSWTYRHYGEWDNNSYNLILRVKLCDISILHKIFGLETCKPRIWKDMGRYNTNPRLGPVFGGRLHLIASKAMPITMSVRCRSICFELVCRLMSLFSQFNFRTQDLRFSFNYCKTRWIQQDYDKSYEVINGSGTISFVDFAASAFLPGLSVASSSGPTSEETPETNVILHQLYDILKSCE